MNRKRIVLATILISSVWSLAVPGPALAQGDSTAQKIIRDVLGIGGEGLSPLIQEGQGITGCGSWVASGGSYRDPMAKKSPGIWQFDNPSDHDLRLLVPEGTTNAEALRIYKDVRGKIETRVRSTFKRDADRILKSINLYPPEQLMRGVGSPEEAIEALRTLPRGTPNLGGLDPEGLWTKGRMEFARAYEGKGRIFFNQGGAMRQGFADLVSDVVKGEPDAILNTIPGATSNAEAFAQKTFYSLVGKKDEDIVKNLKRTEGALQKARGLSAQGSVKSRLYDEILSRVESDPMYLAKPEARSLISRYTKEATLEARLLEKLRTAGDADKQLILRWLEEMRAGAGAWQKLWTVFEKVPLQEAAVVLNGIFTFYQIYVIGEKLYEGDKIGALKEAGIWAIFETAGLGAGLAAVLADTIVEWIMDKAKSFGYELMASTQDCGDLMEGIFTVKGREVNIQDSKIRPLTVDDLVLLYQKPQGIQDAVAARARLASRRGFGEETGKSDEEVAKALISRCYKEMLLKWNAKRRELDREMVGLWQQVDKGPIMLTVTPDPAVFSPKRKPFPFQARVETPQTDIAGIEGRMKDILDRLAGPKEHSQGADFRWTLDGKPLFGSRDHIDFEVESAGEHLLEAELVFKIYSGLNYSRKLPEIRRKVSAPFTIILKEEPAASETEKSKEKIKEGVRPETKKAGEPAAPGKKAEAKPGAKTETAEPKQQGKEVKETQVKPREQAVPSGQPGITEGIQAVRFDLQNIKFTAPTNWKLESSGWSNQGYFSGAQNILIRRNWKGEICTSKYNQQTKDYDYTPLPNVNEENWESLQKQPNTRRTWEVGARIRIGLKKSSSPNPAPSTAGDPASIGPFKGALLKKIERATPPFFAVISGKLVFQDWVLLIAADTPTHDYFFKSARDVAAREEQEWKRAYAEMQAIIPTLNISVPGQADTKAQAGAAGTAAAGVLAVELKPQKNVARPGESLKIDSTPTGGKPPYVYAWTGSLKSGADKPEAVFNSEQTGEHKVALKLTDSEGKTASAETTLTVSSLTARIAMNPSGRKVVLGDARGFQVEVLDGKKKAEGAFDYLWQPHPEVTFNPFEGSAATSAAFTRMGPVKVWAQVFQTTEGRKQTVAESDQLELEVVGPKFSLISDPRDPYVGQEVKLTVSSEPAIQDPPWDYWWEIAGDALNAGPVSQNREYTFIPKDTKAVTVTVHGKAKEGGTDLGERKQTVKARLYEVKIGKPALQGPPPRVWSEKAKGLVELERGIGTFQDFTLSADITPNPADASLRYQWKVEPEGCSVLSPASRETRANAGRGGSYTFNVTVSDSRGIVLGSGEIDVSITEITLPTKAQGAAEKFGQAKTLAGECKLDPAIAAADEAAQLDSRNKDAARLAQDLKDMKSKLQDLLSQAQSLGQQGRFEEASKVLAKAKELCPGYAPLAAYEWQLQNLQKQKGQQQQALQQQQQKQQEAKDKADASGQAEQPQQQKAQAPQQQPQKTTAAEKAEAEAEADRTASAQKLQQAVEQAKQGKYDEAIRLAEEALRLDPENAKAAGRITTWKALKHLQRAGTLGEQGRLDEAYEEVKQAKKIDPNNPKAAEYETWLDGLKKQEADRKTQAANKAAEAERVKQAEAEKAKQAEAEQRKEEQRRSEQAQAETQAKQKTSWTTELTGTSWQGEAVSDTQGGQVTWPIALTIANSSAITGEMTVSFPGDDESKKVGIRGSYDPKTGGFAFQFNVEEEGAVFQGTLSGKASSSTSAQGTIAWKLSGLGENIAIEGTWRLTRR